MAWIHLDDDYVYHPKFTALSAGAFRLWHEGMCYCRKMLTDGVISRTVLKNFHYAKRSFVNELSTPVGNVAPLWEPHPDWFEVHDFLDWNSGAEETQSEREATKLRMRAYRARHRVKDAAIVTPSPVTDGYVTVTPYVRGRGRVLISSSSEKEKRIPPLSSLESDDVSERAGRLVERYCELYTLRRSGAKYRSRPNLDWLDACELVKLWDDARLEKLAILVLTTDDTWISDTDRSFKIFATKASWADDKLAAWEAKQQAQA